MRLSAYTNVSISPVIAFTIWALVDRAQGGSGITSSQAFTSLALFTLMATPLSTLVEAATGVATAIGSIERINKFLYSSSREETRIPEFDRSASSSSASSMVEKASVHNPKNLDDLPHPGVQISEKAVQNGDDSQITLKAEAVVIARDLKVGWSNNDTDAVGPITLSIPHGSLTMVVGPVGCGKSTLLRGLLGETKYREGILVVPKTRIAYCSQTPWLANTTLQNNVLGESLYDLSWYNTVIKACALDKDIKDMGMGDQTVIGTQGAVLSGGQKQRLVGRCSYNGLDADISGACTCRILEA